MDIVTYLRALRAWLIAFPRWTPPKRYRALLSMRNGHQFVRYFNDIDDAKSLCNDIAMLDDRSSEASGHEGRFDWFEIEDTRLGLTYHVEDFDEHFGIAWTQPTGRP